MANVFNYKDETFYTGDTVRVHLNVNEGDKTRIQIFEGMIIKIRGSLENKTFTVRKIAANSVGVERILPVLSPSIAKLEKKAEGKVRRAKLYYLRDRIGKRALKVKVKDTQKSANVDSSETDISKTSSKSAKPKAASKASNGKSRGTASKKTAAK